MREKKKQRRRRQRAVPRMSDHARRCSVCRHPEREAIEEAFLDWGNVTRLTEEFHLAGRTAIYRHARALSLDTRRESNMRSALAHIIEKSSTVRPSADAVVRAVELHARLYPIPDRVEPFVTQNPIATPSSRT